LTITKGRIRHFALPHALEDINGPLQFDTQGINLDGLTGRLARGDVRFSGRINKEGYLPGRLDVHMTGTDMQLRFPEGMRSSLVDANLDLTGTVEDATLSGLVNIKDALYTKSFDPTGSFFNFGRGETPAPAPPPSDTTTLPLRYQIRINAPGTLQVRNNTLRLVAEADLELRGTYDKPIIIGRVEVQNGDATVFAKKFVLTRATVDFNNPTRIEPFYDIEAEARIRVPGETYRVTVRAAGPPDRLRNLSFQSDPPLPEADVMALVFSDIAPGGNVELAYYRNSTTPQVQLAQEQAARALTGMLGANEVNRAAEKALGVDTFQITPSLNDPQTSRLEPGARVTLLKRVSDRVSITYSRSLAATATRDQIIVLEYDQTDKFSWILSRNEDGTYALDWQVRKAF
jgi:autotransporter translocation and assembly factor TamB